MVHVADAYQNVLAPAVEQGVRSRSLTTATPVLRLRDKLFLFLTRADGDFAGVFQAADDIDDLLLHRFDVRQPHGAEVIPFLP